VPPERTVANAGIFPTIPVRDGIKAKLITQYRFVHIYSTVAKLGNKL